jgi:hypothetical protein
MGSAAAKKVRAEPVAVKVELAPVCEVAVTFKKRTRQHRVLSAHPGRFAGGAQLVNTMETEHLQRLQEESSYAAGWLLPAPAGSECCMVAELQRYLRKHPGHVGATQACDVLVVPDELVDHVIGGALAQPPGSICVLSCRGGASGGAAGAGGKATPPPQPARQSAPPPGGALQGGSEKAASREARAAARATHNSASQQKQAARQEKAESAVHMQEQQSGASAGGSGQSGGGVTRRRYVVVFDNGAVRRNVPPTELSALACAHCADSDSDDGDGAGTDGAGADGAGGQTTTSLEAHVQTMTSLDVNGFEDVHMRAREKAGSLEVSGGGKVLQFGQIVDRDGGLAAGDDGFHNGAPNSLRYGEMTPSTVAALATLVLLVEGAASPPGHLKGRARGYSPPGAGVCTVYELGAGLGNVAMQLALMLPQGADARAGASAGAGARAHAAAGGRFHVVGLEKRTNIVQLSKAYRTAVVKQLKAAECPLERRLAAVAAAVELVESDFLLDDFSGSGGGSSGSGSGSGGSGGGSASGPIVVIANNFGASHLPCQRTLNDCPSSSSSSPRVR